MPFDEPLPDWVILHIPHDSMTIPGDCRELFILEDGELERELLRMTDLHTCELFAGNACPGQVVRFPVSRLLVDPERFPEDSDEPMAARGQGAIYTRTSDGRQLKRKLSRIERNYLMDRYYFPHHDRLTARVDTALKRYGKALVMDCHSFSSSPLPAEPCQDPRRQQICIGTDSVHTPPRLADGAAALFAAAGFSVSRDTPFSGALSPLFHYHHDRRVASIMIEVRRDLYADERTGSKLMSFPSVSGRIRHCMEGAAALFSAGSSRG
jgi:N-formylglutamate amidohydrolase